MIPWLSRGDAFPPAASALAEPNGLLAAGGDLSAPRLLAAYRQGIFPWYSDGEPILWWSPDPRMVLFPTEIKISRSLARALKRRDYAIRLDTSFREVMAACAAPREDGPGTWISDDIQAAYRRLHEIGYAHSVETWAGRDGKQVLVGGLYGIAIGRAFYGESMFSRVSDASKIALAHLCRLLERQGFAVIDCQMSTRHLASLGARQIPRAEFVSGLERWAADEHACPPGRWPADAADDLFRGVP